MKIEILQTRISEENTMFYIAVNSVHDSMLCEDYLYCSLKEYQEIAIKYKAQLIPNILRPLFYSKEEAQFFLEDWMRARLVMKQLTNQL